MITKLATYVFVGSDADLASLKTMPAVLHAAKEPWHRKFVGYQTPGAPKEDPEYLWAIRGDEMALNLIDVDDPLYVPFSLMDKAVNFVNYFRTRGRNVFIHCNQGVSRGPTVAFLAIAPLLDPDYAQSRASFEVIYPAYQPKLGMELFSQRHWSYFHADK